jgi:hypothetical protein
MIRRTLGNLRAVLAVLPLVAFVMVGVASSNLHILLPAGSHWS